MAVKEKVKMQAAPLEKGTGELEISFSAVDLSSLVSRVSLAVSTQSPNEILRHILIQATLENGVAFAGTDQELSMVARSSTPTVALPGTVVLPLKEITAISSLSEDVINLKVVDGVATFSSTDAVWVSNSAVSDLFPDLVSISDAARPLPVKAFLRALESVSPAICTDESRPSLMMAHVGSDGIYATDGTRAHFAVMESEFDGMNIPLAAIKPLKALLKASTEDYLYVEQTETHLIFLVGQDEFAIRILDSQFPQVRQSMIDPRHISHVVEVSIPRERIRLALRRASVVSDDGSGSVTLRFDRGSCVLAALNMKGSRVSTTIEINYTGSTRQASFLIDSLQDPQSRKHDDGIFGGLNQD